MIEYEAFFLVLEKTPETDKKTKRSQDKAIQNSPLRQKMTRLKVLSYMRRQGCFEKSLTPGKVEGKRKGRLAAKWMDSIHHFIILIAKTKADCRTFCHSFGYNFYRVFCCSGLQYPDLRQRSAEKCLRKLQPAQRRRRCCAAGDAKAAAPPFSSRSFEGAGCFSAARRVL